MSLLTVDSLRSLKDFSAYSYAANALERWHAARVLRDTDKKLFRIPIIEGYEMAIEQFLKHIISHTGDLSRDHIHSHKVWGLACDAQLNNREKYRRLLQRFGQYYDEARYESDDPEERQAILDYLTDDDILDSADDLLLVLYTEAKNVDISTSKRANNTSRTGIKKLMLM